MSARSIFGFVALWFAVSAHSATSSGEDLFSGFESGWRKPWMERAMARRSNTFRLESENENRFLRIDSRNSASALWRQVYLDVTQDTVVSWRWRVSNSLGHVKDERRRGSDDYAARVVVMFDGKPFGRDTPFLMYVWAGNEPVGNIYPSPYTETAVTIVLRSGDTIVVRYVFRTLALLIGTINLLIVIAGMAVIEDPAGASWLWGTVFEEFAVDVGLKWRNFSFRDDRDPQLRRTMVLYFMTFDGLPERVVKQQCLEVSGQLPLDRPASEVLAILRIVDDAFQKVFDLAGDTIGGSFPASAGLRPTLLKRG